MTLTPCSDLSAAGWLTAGDLPEDQLVGFGPAGFPAYARLRFLPDPAWDGQRENDVDLGADAPTETEQLRIVLSVLSRHTRAPSDCYFCLWDGWGLQAPAGGEAPHSRSGLADQATSRPDPPREPEPGIDPSFRPPVPTEPMVVLPNRAYLLFSGSVTDLGERGSATRWPGQPHLGTADPAFIWPADHAWCVANDVDPHWAGIGASAEAIEELVTDPGVDVVRADPRARQPHYR